MKILILILKIIAIVIGLLIPIAMCAQENGDVSAPGELYVVSDKADANKLILPLKHTKVKADIAGYVATVEVQQIFQNPYKEKIEARYVFPLPENGAVYEMIMKIGDKIIYSEVKEKEEARRTYEEARNSGHRAALLEQERPNIFSQTVGNIMPGDEIVIVIRYIQDLKFKAGEYTYFFPTVVGPRYIPGNVVGNQGGGFSPDTDKVPDASKITPWGLPPGTRSGHDIDIIVNITAGTPVKNIKSLSHIVQASTNGKTVTVKLIGADNIPNKDFILNYAVSGADPTTGILTHKKDSEGYLSLMIVPPKNAQPAKITPKEIIFVVDGSGSMGGEPTTKIKAAMRYALQHLNPGDYFQIIQFDNNARDLAPQPLLNTPDNISKALRFVNEMQGAGGTEMLNAMKKCLSYPKNPGVVRIILFMTDGFVGNEAEVISYVRKGIGDGRLFSFGIGSSVNRYLVEGVADAGRGRCEIIPLQEDTQKVVSEFYSRISSPYWTDLSIDWGGIKVTEVFPKVIPDLFINSPVLVTAKYLTSGPATVRVKGKLAGQDYFQTVNILFPETNSKNKVLPIVWARKKIGEYEKEINKDGYEDPNSPIKQEIIKVSLKYKLISRYTSMVAVERDIITDPTVSTRKIDVPVELPEGVSYRGVFGDAKLTLQRVKPGDPELIVSAPSNAVSVIASFPFGFVKLLSKEMKTGHWTCRFLIPRSFKDGVYVIKVVITCLDGERYEKLVPITVDSLAPSVDVRAEVVENPAGRLLRIVAVPKQLSSAMADILIRTQVLADIHSISLKSWDGSIIKLRLTGTPETLFWTVDIPLQDSDTGTKLITVESLDFAGNVSHQEMEVELK